ncbi:hypothetical protein NG791_02720 [Laspinema sp. D1]|nr:hypothetical protein [Laspinema sp. D2b]
MKFGSICGRLDFDILKVDVGWRSPQQRVGAIGGLTGHGAIASVPDQLR